MSEIFVVFTSHSELGECNSEELHKIIESAKPDVIFEELTISLYNLFYSNDQVEKEPLEVKAIKRYLKNYSVEHLPVDIEPSQDLSTEDINYMLGELNKYDIYRKIKKEQSDMTYLYGFSFLNSDKCRQLFKQQKETEEMLIQFMINKNHLLKIHKLFYDEHDRRENEMIKNTYNYYSKNQFNRALFFIGSGHGASIVKKVNIFNTQKSDGISWKLYGDLIV